MDISSLFSAESPHEIRAFGDSLFKQEDYYRAITEYKKFLYFYPVHPKRNEIKFSIGFSYLKGSKYDAALPYFQRLSTQKKNVMTEISKFSLAQTYFLSNKYETALNEWNEFLEQFPKSKLSDAVLYQQGWAYFLNENVDEAKKHFFLIQRPPLQKETNAFVLAMQKWEDRPSRSPFLAGMMSAILPGSGQWYTGHFWDGISALVINGLFIYGIYDTFYHRKYVIGGILVFIGSGFYGGNIFSAVSGAHTFNKQVKESLLQEFKTKYELNFDWNGSSLTMRF